MALKKQWMNIKGQIVLATLKEEIKVAYTESEMKALKMLPIENRNN